MQNLIKNEGSKVIYNYASSIMLSRNLLSGAGLAYALENETPMEAPLALLFPSIYAGYHLYKNRMYLGSLALAAANKKAQ